MLGKTLETDFICTVPWLTVYELAGEDAITYLQSQVTADVVAMDAKQSSFSSHCDAKGKTLANYLLVKQDSKLSLVSHSDSAQKAFTELKKYGVFSKVEFSHSDKQFIGGAGQDFEAWITEYFGHCPTDHLATENKNSEFVVRFDSPFTRYLLALDTDTRCPLTFSTQVDWMALDILSGIPHVEAANSAEFVPQMMNMQVLDAISFTKGCYMGQETVARTRYLGKNKRAAFVLSAPQLSTLEAGSQLEYQIGENWRPGGTVLSCATHADKTWVFAVLNKETETGQIFRCKHQPDTKLSVEPLPYLLED